MPRIQLPDGTEVDAPADATARTVAAGIGEGLAKAAIGARVAGELIDADRPLAEAAPAGTEEPLALGIITAPRSDKKGRSKWRDDAHERDALNLLRHSTAHVMAEAIQRIVPGAMLVYGLLLDTGFYYDIAFPELPPPPRGRLRGDRSRDEKSIVKADRRFTRYDMPVQEGMAKLKSEAASTSSTTPSRPSKPVQIRFRSMRPVKSDRQGARRTFAGPISPAPARSATSRSCRWRPSYWHGDENPDRLRASTAPRSSTRKTSPPTSTSWTKPSSATTA